MPNSPKQRKLAVVGSRAVGTFGTVIAVITQLLTPISLRSRQVIAHGSICRESFRRVLLSHNRELFYRDDKV